MIQGLSIRQATEADSSTVVDLWEEAKAWLASKGLDQWQYPVKMHNVRKAIDEGSCWLIEAATGHAIGTVTLNEDSTLWLPKDNPDDALYLHRLVVQRGSAGREIGSAVLDWAADQAASLGKRFLRLDAWSNNSALHRYYLDRGFRLVRIVNNPDIPSGALFERTARRERGDRASRSATPGQ